MMTAMMTTTRMICLIVPSIGISPMRYNSKTNDNQGDDDAN